MYRTIHIHINLGMNNREIFFLHTSNCSACFCHRYCGRNLMKVLMIHVLRKLHDKLEQGALIK